MKKYKILIVDDDEEYKKNITKFLTDYDIVEVSSGEEALELIKTQYFNCILIDYILPGMMGDVLVQKLKENAVDSPIIMITAYGDELLAVQMMKMKVADYITKHLIDELPTLVSRIISEDLKRKENLNKILEKTNKVHRDISVLTEQLKQDQKSVDPKSK